MKKIICLTLLCFSIIIPVSAQITNGQYIRNIQLLSSRWNDWRDRCQSYWNTQFNSNNQYIGAGSYEDYVYQQGAYCGIAAAMSEAIDKCISLDLRMVMDYSWLGQSNSDYFYNISQKSQWANNLSESRKKIYDFGYFMGYLSITGESARFPNIWEWKNISGG